MPPARWTALAPFLPIVLAQVAGVLCGLAGVRIISRLVPPDIYGVYGVFLSLTPLGMWVVHSGLIQHVRRHWQGAESQTAYARLVVQAALRRMPLLAAAAVVAAPAALGTAGWRLLPALLVASTLLVFATLAQTALQASRQHWRDCAVSVVGSVTRSFGPPLLVLWAGASAGILAGGFCVHAACLAGAGAWFFREHARASRPPAPAAVPSFATYQGSAFLVLAVIGWTFSGMNRWLVVWFEDDTHAGLFTLASNIALIVPTILNTTLLQYFTPRLYAQADRTDGSGGILLARADFYAAVFTVLSVAGLAGLRLIAPYLIGPLISEAYRDSLGYLLGAGMFGVTTGIAQFYQALLLAQRRETACLPVGLATFAVLTTGGILAAALSMEAFTWWLIGSPAVSWLVVRPLVRRGLRPGGCSPTPASATPAG